MITVFLIAMASQCGPGGCPAPLRYLPTYRPDSQLQVFVQPQAALAPAPAPLPAYGWHRTTYNGLSFKVWGFITDRGLIEWSTDLRENQDNYWAARDAQQKAKAKASKPEPKPEPKAEQLAVNYGVDPSKLNRREVYTANSPEAQSFVVQAQAAAEGKSDRIYLTVIGAPEDRKGIADDWRNSPQFRPWQDRVWFQEFARGDWQVKDELGYEGKGKPTVLVQKPGGAVVLRATQYSGPTPILTALRKADPSYRPNDDPSDEGEHSDESVISHRTVLAILAALAVAVFFIPRKRAC